MNTSSLAGKYLTVTLAEEAYGLTVLRVREIIRPQKITPVPQLPGFIKGVINLRGRVVPVIDLRLKLGLPDASTAHGCVVVVEVALSTDSTVHMGLVVDSVEEVVSLTADQIEPPPGFGVRVDTCCLLGMAKVNGQVKILLDLDRVVAADTLRLLTSAA